MYERLWRRIGDRQSVTRGNWQLRRNEGMSVVLGEGERAQKEEEPVMRLINVCRLVLTMIRCTAAVVMRYEKCYLILLYITHHHFVRL